MLVETGIKPCMATCSNPFIYKVSQTCKRLPETCQRCNRPAAKEFTVYNPFRYSYLDVRVCEDCYSNYIPTVKKSGEIVWKRTKPFKTYVLFTVLGSRRAAAKLSELLDRVVGSWLVRLYVRLSAYAVVALLIAAVTILVNSTRWYILNQGTEAFERVRNVYRGSPFTSTGLLGIDPVFPLLEAAVAFILACTLHELGHALFLRFYGYDVRRVGLFFIGPFPLGAFVESPGSIEGRTGWRQALELAGSGVLMNVLLGLAGLTMLHVMMAGIVPLTPEAAGQLSVYKTNLNLQLAPPLLLSALGLNTPMYAPPGWYTHALLGDAYILPMRFAGYMASINLLAALFNSLPIRGLDGGLAFRSLLRSRMGEKEAVIAVKYATVIVTSMIGYVHLIVRV